MRVLTHYFRCQCACSYNKTESVCCVCFASYSAFWAIQAFENMRAGLGVRPNLRNVKWLHLTIIILHNKLDYCVCECLCELDAKLWPSNRWLYQPGFVRPVKMFACVLTLINCVFSIAFAPAHYYLNNICKGRYLFGENIRNYVLPYMNKNQS